MNTPVDCHYVALSYVWQNTSVEADIRLKTSNYAQLTLEGALSCTDMPEVIWDAMVLSCDLREQYLWVDRLRIIQDDAENWDGQISAMDRI